MTETFTLVVVAALVAAGAWLLARAARPGIPDSPLLQVIASVHVGPRERVVLVEAGDAWLVIGVAPGRVSAIHTLARDPVARPGPQRPFADWLRALTVRHGAR
ncbi:MAG: flagellar biosynthetic protein FliO [Betaproteobacteria bacterium]